MALRGWRGGGESNAGNELREQYDIPSCVVVNLQIVGRDGVVCTQV